MNYLYCLGRIKVIAMDKTDKYIRRAMEEILAYAFKLTGKWPTGEGAVIELRCGAGEQLSGGGPDPDQNHALYTECGLQVVHGATSIATLWAAYKLIESWGVGFYLGGDVIPECDPDIRVQFVNSTHKPVFKIRGCAPWFNFYNSPTTWNPQDYRTFFEQIVRQRGNFVGFHVYKHEPFCSMGEDDEHPQPLLTTTAEQHRDWAPPLWGTDKFPFGIDQFYTGNTWGTEVGLGDKHQEAVRKQQEMLVNALYAARDLGLKTCIGFEISGDLSDKPLAEMFEQRMTHMLELYKPDYVWIWYPEPFNVHVEEGRDAIDPVIRKTFEYINLEFHSFTEASRLVGWSRIAYRIANSATRPAKLIVSGWGGENYLHFSDLYKGLDKLLPSDVIFAALEHIDPMHGDMQNEYKVYGVEGPRRTYIERPGHFISAIYGELSPMRERWPIPWFESDGFRNSDQTGPQPNVISFEQILNDAEKKGCQGILGIHWRTRNIREVAGYTFRKAWDTNLTAEKYYQDYASRLYGANDAEEMSALHRQLEKFGSQYCGAPGSWECDVNFSWFSGGFLPYTERLEKLHAIEEDLLLKMGLALSEGRGGHAIELHDLAMTIRWLVLRAETGLAIMDFNTFANVDKYEFAKEKCAGKSKKEIDGPLAFLLAETEEMACSDPERKGMTVKLKNDLQHLHFCNAFAALASTVRTRGEMGMLATAASRYGRAFIEFADRINDVIGNHEDTDSRTWTGGELHLFFSVPKFVAAGESVVFDAVLIPGADTRPCALKMNRAGTGDEPVTLLMKPIAKAYHRAVFTPLEPGCWEWCIQPVSDADRGELPWPSGVFIAE